MTLAEKLLEIQTSLKIVTSQRSINNVYNVIDSLQECVEMAKKYEWVSVNDRLPDKPGSYLVIGRTGGAKVTRWYAPNKYNNFKGCFGGHGAEHIRYWMLRPEPPEE